jgi:ribosomal protein S18 acetylase RimI-like enzyme
MQIDNLTHHNLERIAPLWLDLHAHHQAVAPELVPYADENASWNRRRQQYSKLFANGGEIIVAREGSADIGYAAWVPERMPWPACFATAPRLAEIVTLTVRPAYRGRGIGTALLSGLSPRIAAGGFTTEMVGVVPSNRDAVLLYQKWGYRPTWMILSRFGRPAPPVNFENKRPDIPIELVAFEDVEMLRHCWLGVHHQHRAVAPHLGPYVSDDESWTVYARTFRESARQGLLWRLGAKDSPSGMACASILKDPKAFADTWATAGPIAEVEVLAVDPELRGLGLGSQIMQVMDRRLTALGIVNQFVGAIATNSGAIRLYARLDYRPTWLLMTRFPERVDSSVARAVSMPGGSP